MLQPFLIATGNQGKFLEILEVLSELTYEFYSLNDLPLGASQIEEIGDSHEANARLKASHFYKATGWITLGEDSGIEVDGLKGELGFHTRRWGAGETASDEVWLAHFLERIHELSPSERIARFVCCAVLKIVPQEEHMFWGETRGVIMLEPEAPLPPGLPLSSVFKPDGFDRVYAALSPFEKNQISHRGLAMGKVRKFLENITTLW